MSPAAKIESDKIYRQLLAETQENKLSDRDFRECLLVPHADYGMEVSRRAAV